jgi:hemoglobin-like flavoprotein
MKLLWFAALFVCVALAMADDNPHYKCGPLQKVKVRRQWDHAYGDGKHRLEFANHVFHKFFHDYPKAREMFAKFRSENIYSPEFQAMAQRLLESFSMVIDTADDPEVLKVMFQVVKVDHKEKGVKPEFYDAFRDELMEVLAENLGTHLDWDAWMGCTNLIIENLK